MELSKKVCPGCSGQGVYLEVGTNKIKDCELCNRTGVFDSSSIANYILSKKDHAAKKELIKDIIKSLENLDKETLEDIKNFCEFVE